MGSLPFNKDSTEWQYASRIIVPEKNYSSITYYLTYYNNANTASFDGIQLYKDNFGQSYDYDSNGNLKKVSREATKQNSQFNYKISEGKTKSQALVCVMRRLVNIIYGMMKNKTEYIALTIEEQYFFVKTQSEPVLYVGFYIRFVIK